MDDVRVVSGTLIVDLRLSWARSLKDRRKVLRSLVERLRQEDYAVAQVGPPDLVQRVFLAVADVSGDAAHLAERIDHAERMIFASDFEVASIQRDDSVWTDSSLR